MTQLRDENGRFVATEEGIVDTQEDIVDAEWTEGSGGELAVVGSSEVAVIPEPSALPETLLGEELRQISEVKRPSAERETRLAELVVFIERLFPEMHQPVGRRLHFDWPEMPAYSELVE